MLSRPSLIDKQCEGRKTCLRFILAFDCEVREDEQSERGRMSERRTDEWLVLIAGVCLQQMVFH